MPYVPHPSEARRLRLAIDEAMFSEGERILWLTSFVGVLGVMLFSLFSPTAFALAGVGGALGGLAVLYWRLRGAHLSGSEQGDLHGIGLRSREQRAFTALMLRAAVMGRNPLAPRLEHDPFGAGPRRLYG